MVFSIILECLWAVRKRSSRPPRILLLLLAVISLASLAYLRGVLFGFGPTRIGGLWGRLWDNTLRKSLFEGEEYAHEKRFLELTGYPLPPIQEQGVNTVGVQTLLHSWLAKSVMSRIRRRQARGDFMQQCNIKSCPLHVIIQPNLGEWYRPVEWERFNATTTAADARFAMLEFDEEDVVEFMMEHYGPLYKKVYSKVSVDIRAQLFGIAAVYHHGGIFVAPTIRTSSQLLHTDPSFGPWLRDHSSNERDNGPSLWLQTTNNDRIQVLAATPRHPSVKCAINEVLVPSHGESAGWDTFVRILRHNHWDPTCEPQCCPLLRLTNTTSTDVVLSVPAPDQWETPNDRSPSTATTSSVSIQESGSTAKSMPRPKVRCSERLGHCSPGWLCNRCLRTPLMGNFRVCWWPCRSCYVSTVCTPAAPLRNVTVEVRIERPRPGPSTKRIPRMIHQTYYDTLTAAEYPHLQRLQNSWKASGWDYRFYNDDDCHNFIRQNYPQRFVDAFDAIIPGAFKADIFRLLVLFKEGGVYADVDVQMDVDLDAFVTANLSFFIPVDVPVDYWPNSNYCLWNGLMGAEPGHPILAKAIEDVVNTVLNRVDYYDVEGRFCSQSLDAEIWKLRTLPIVILTGPCALGMSVNKALGNNNLLQGFDASKGWLRDTPDSWGDVLLLLADRFDLGELRFIDLGRNMIVASSNQDRLAKSAINVNPGGKDTSSGTVHVHYSKTETDIVGEFGTYIDHNSSFEQIRFELHFQPM